MFHSRLTKPKVSEVNRWDLDPELGNQYASVYFADIDDAFIKVVPTHKGKHKIKYFYGETAWQDARRYAGDIWSARYL